MYSFFFSLFFRIFLFITFVTLTRLFSQFFIEKNDAALHMLHIPLPSKTTSPSIPICYLRIIAVYSYRRKARIHRITTIVYLTHDTYSTNYNRYLNTHKLPARLCIDSEEKSRHFVHERDDALLQRSEWRDFHTCLSSHGAALLLQQPSLVHLCFINVPHATPKPKNSNFLHLLFESNSRSATDMDDQDLSVLNPQLSWSCMLTATFTDIFT
jgi:hypothetical protein